MIRESAGTVYRTEQESRRACARVTVVVLRGSLSVRPLPLHLQPTRLRFVDLQKLWREIANMQIS